MIDQHSPSTVVLSTQDVRAPSRLVDDRAIWCGAAQTPVDDHQGYVFSLMNLPNVGLHDRRKRQHFREGAAYLAATRMHNARPWYEYRSRLIKGDQRIERLRGDMFPESSHQLVGRSGFSGRHDLCSFVHVHWTPCRNFL